MNAPLDGAALLAKIKPQLAEDEAKICLRPDLIEAWEDACTRLSESEVGDKVGQRLANGVSAKTKKLAREVVDLEEQIADSTVTFRFRGMSKDKYRALCDNHPPRKDHQVDLMLGYNHDAVNDQMVRGCLIDPVFDDESWAELCKFIVPTEWNELRATVNRVNGGVVDAPKSERASLILSKRASGSRQPAAGESAPAGSTGGSRRKSTSTSTQPES